jgi:hypothetical protein
MRSLNSAPKWRMLRNLGLSLTVAGASVGMWGALSLTSVSASPTPLTATITISCNNSCNPALTSTTTTSDCNGVVGWHFVLTDKDASFVSITAVFLNAGTVTYAGPFTNGGTQTPNDGTGFTTSGNDTLESATAVITNGSVDDFFVLSGIICGSTSSSSSSSSSTTSTQSTSSTESTGSTESTTSTTSTGTGGVAGTSTTSTTSAAATGNGLGAGTLGASITLPAAGFHAAPPSGYPLGIGFGLMVAGLAMLGISFRRKETI